MLNLLNFVSIHVIDFLIALQCKCSHLLHTKHPKFVESDTLLKLELALELALELELLLAVELEIVLELYLVPKGMNTGAMSNHNAKLWAIFHACSLSSAHQVAHCCGGLRVVYVVIQLIS